jgi:hypothetical protein
MKKYLIGAVAMMLVSGAAPAQNLVKNGGFENATTTSSTGNFQIGGSFGTVADWSSTQGYNLLFNASNATTGNAYGTYSWTGNEKLWGASASSQGGKFLALDGDVDARGLVSQTITGLTKGATYVLSFEWAAGQLQSRVGDTTEQLKVDFGTDSFSTDVISNPSQGFSGWKTVSRSFVATSGSQVLSFLSLGTPTGLPPIALLDNVSVTAAVPEPGTWMTMLLGFGVVGGVIRRRKPARAQLV